MTKRKVPPLPPHPLDTNQERFGRLPSIDHRDRLHLLPRPFGLEHKWRYWFAPPILDQGDTPQCVAFSGEGFLPAGPVINKPWKTPAELYAECQKVDEWKDQPHDGTSVRALFQVLAANGFIKEYKWATEVNTVLEHVLQNGPVVFGTDWYESMFDTVKDAKKKHWLNVDESSGIAGGHAYLILGASRSMKAPDGTVGALQMQNSWGDGWGDKGRAFISLAAADRLIRAWGEACTSLEIVAQETAATKKGEPTGELLAGQQAA
jgi:hypothetical protein